jgi:hypothetical protein
MTREEFMELLSNKDYSFYIKTEGGKIIVTEKWDVWLSSLESLPPEVEFKNGGDVYLEALKSLPPGVEFNNKGNVNLESIMGVWFSQWKGHIYGVDSKRLLNFMISKGLFKK